MTIALVANTAAGSTNNSSVTTSAINTTGATLLVVVVNDSSASSTVTDSKSNTWVLAASSGAFTDRSDTRIYYVASPTVGSGHTFTNTSAGPTILVQAYSGVTTTSPLDQIKQYDTNNVPFGDIKLSYGPGAITPGFDNEVVVVGAGHSDSGTATLDAGFTVSGTVSSAGGQCWGGAAGYKIQTTAAAADPDFDGVNAYVSMCAATFKAVAAGGAFIAEAPLVVSQSIKRGFW